MDRNFKEQRTQSEDRDGERSAKELDWMDRNSFRKGMLFERNL